MVNKRINLNQLKTNIFADGANYKDILILDKNKLIKGYTTNPSLLKKNGVKDYKKFAKKILKKIKNKPISFEVIADKLIDIEKQAHEISSWGKNVYVKIPVTNTKGEFCGPIIKKLSKNGIKLNITAIFTQRQVNRVIQILDPKTPSFISIFSGRIADTGHDPKIIIINTLKKLKKTNTKIIWASPREAFNIIESSRIGCHIITVTPELLTKFFSLLNKNLEKYSIETVKMFFEDGKKSKLKV